MDADLSFSGTHIVAGWDFGVGYSKGFLALWDNSGRTFIGGKEVKGNPRPRVIRGLIHKSRRLKYERRYARGKQ